MVDETMKEHFDRKRKYSHLIIGQNTKKCCGGIIKEILDVKTFILTK
jgi:hypothetical protein